MASMLQSVSEGLAGLVETLGGAVVRVEGRRRMPASGAVWPQDGLVVTAHHVLEEDEVAVGLAAKESSPAELIGRDPTTDLALLRVLEALPKAPAWSGPEGVRVGHLVLALARPGGRPQATLGIVSALDGGWRTPASGQLDHFLQTDVVMAPGFSGGPLVSMAGEILGINSSALVRGLSLTIPTTTVRRVVESLLAHGRVRRGYLGVGVQPVRLPQPLAEAAGQEMAVLLNSVEPGGPADQAGLTLGDALLSLDGQSLLHPEGLVALLRGELVGRRATVRFIRGGKVEERTLTVGERP